MGQPHAEAEGNKRVRKASGQLQRRHLLPAAQAAEHRRAPDKEHRQNDQSRDVRHAGHQERRPRSNQGRRSIAPLQNRRDHARGVDEGAESQHHDEGRQVGALAEPADARANGVVPQVPSRAARQGCRRCHEDRRGYSRGKTCSPCCSTFAAGTGGAHIRGCLLSRGYSPWSGTKRMPPSSRTWISSGEMSDCTKLNWPIGQTYLQKDAPRKKPSITKAAAK